MPMKQVFKYPSAKGEEGEAQRCCVTQSLSHSHSLLNRDLNARNLACDDMSLITMHIVHVPKSLCSMFLDY